MKRKLFALLLCMVFICTLSLPVYADSVTTSSDGYSALISDIPKTCPTCGSSLHAFWFSTSGAEVELTISDNGTIKIPAGAGVVASIRLYCTNCKYEKNETRLLGLDWGSERPGEWKVEKVPTGIGRKDLPGYASDDGTPAVGSDGTFRVIANYYIIPNSSIGFNNRFAPDSWSVTKSGISLSVSSSGISAHNYTTDIGCSSYFYGFYWVDTSSFGSGVFVLPSNSFIRDEQKYVSYKSDDFWGKVAIKSGRTFSVGSSSNVLYFSYTNGSVSYGSSANTISCSKLSHVQLSSGGSLNIAFPYVYLNFIPDSGLPSNSKNITINNNTWNGNIYVDNSTNLTYIYPEYTTINENNETVTNISETPIIYNSETKQYYTYDSVTNNYYYITYEQQPATPTPSPSPSPSPAPTKTPSPSESPAPTPTPDPSSDPTPSPTPGGGTTVTPGGDNPGSTSTPESGNKGDSGSSGWNPFKWLADLLKDIVEKILKAIWKLITSIFGFLLWLLSLVGKLFPFIPAQAVTAITAGAVIVTVIRIIKFITGR